MPTSLNEFQHVLQKIDPHSKLLRAWELKGGISAQVTALEVEQPDGQTKNLIVRQHGPTDLKRNPQIAADEYKLLQCLHSTGLSVPAPYYLDQSSEIFSSPYLVIEYIDGTPEFAPTNLSDFISQFATHLARVHSIDYAKLALPSLPQQTQFYAQKLCTRPAILDESLDEGRIRDVLEAALPFPQQNRPVLLHGDYWPGNILWKDSQLVAIIDWEDAALGDPLADIGNSRLELLWAFGTDAMHSFTEHYLALTNIDATSLPYWDLCAALRLGPIVAECAGGDASTEKTMREQCHWFITQAFAKLSAL